MNGKKNEKKEERKERRKRKKRKEARKKARESMGDYFVAVCWRAWFCFGTFLAAVVAAATVDVEIAINGFFWQLVMRYMVIGGFVWTVVYIVFAGALSFASRMMSWRLLHPNISRSRFFVLIDAKDHEKKNKSWRNCKVLTMITSLVLFIACMIGGGILLFFSNDASGFVLFIGVIWIFYYFTNLFMSCKPYGLVSLWTDHIPPPGKNFFAHFSVSEGLKEHGVLDNVLRLSTNHEKNSPLVRIGTNHEVEMTKNDDGDGDYYKNNTEKKPKKDSEKKHKYRMSGEDVDALSMHTGIAAYAPGLKPSVSHEAFSTERVSALLRRYKKFSYKYKEVDEKKREKSCMLQYGPSPFFWNNYKNYWLNVYRPFDEYDMEANLTSTGILHGFQWLKPCLECRCCQKKTKTKRCGKCCSYMMDNTCSILLVVIIAAFIGMLFLFAGEIGGAIGDENALTTISTTNETQFYPVCSDYFGEETSNEDEHELSVLDVLFLSQAVYEMDNFVLEDMIREYFDDEYEVITEVQEVPYYFHMAHKTKNLDFLSIRGTAGTQEALQDISLFVEVGLFESLQMVMPFLYALPTSFITSLIYYASLTERLINADVRDEFDEPIYEYLSEYLENTTTSMHVLGHSLGGGISAIVAARLYEDDLESHIGSFGVCSPGVLYSSAKFGFGVEALDKTCRSVLPRRDLVSKVDVHGGAVQYTQCDEDSMLNCHVMGSVICEVYQNCPSELARKPEIFDCFCNDYEQYAGQQFGYCFQNVTFIDA